ncbi:MAG: DUF5060 domain-containing protein [Gammaproteobacteria bacterium]
MKHIRLSRLIPVFLFVAMMSIHSAAIAGATTNWHPLTIDFVGPLADETDTTPNPFLDFRLQVTFSRPDGSQFVAPGFFDGDGNGTGNGSIWRVRIAPDQPGDWTYVASFREGTNVAIDLTSAAGQPTAFDGQGGSFTVLPTDPDAAGFASQGRLEYVGGHYLKFRDGDFWIKGGIDSPENFLGYDGFDNTVTNGFVHRYPTHVGDWNAGDPDFVSADTGYEGKAIIGALNYLASENINSFYFLPMNLGGDGKDTYPFVGRSGSDFDNTHYDISKLHQWNIVLEHAQNVGVAAHFVLNETEAPNENWLDNGALGTQRKLFYRELAARFGYLLAKKWNLCEENDYSVPLLNDFASYLAAQDPSDAPITVHTKPNSFSDYNAIVGDPRYSATSIQYNPNLAGQHVETWRANSASAGRPWVLDMDENNPANSGLNSGNAVDLRKRVLWDVYLSGGHVEWYFGGNGQTEGGDQNTEDLRTREEMYRYMWYARRLLQDELPFASMQPADNLVDGENASFGGAEVFALAGTHYAVYLPNAAGTPTIDLTAVAGNVTRRWFNPQTGDFEGEETTLPAGGVIPIGSPPARVSEDWTVLFVATDGQPQVPEVIGLTLIDAVTNLPVPNMATLTDGAVIDLAGLPNNSLSVEALANAVTVSVAFTFSGPDAVAFENVRPFALFGDTDGDFNGWQATPGTYTLAATPYAGIGATGQSGTVVNVSFAVIDSTVADTDGDGIDDANDNCTLAVNPSQRDTDGDGFGNVCDADFNNDQIVNVVDLGLLRVDFFANGDLDTDLNGDGVVNASDLGLLRDLFLQPPGPSGVNRMR